MKTHSFSFEKMRTVDEKRSYEDTDTILPENQSQQLFFSEFGLSPIIAASPLRELPLFPPFSPFHSKMSKSAVQEPMANSNLNDSIPRKHKQCHCRQSKCLKLYCECFASGVYCDECDCVDCHNNIENWDLRQKAIENILDRNPNAFRRKFSNSPGSIHDNQDETKYVTEVGASKRGCRCKRTKCLKRYCECFQANFFCSVNCKCINCENVEELTHRAVSALEANYSELCLKLGETKDKIVISSQDDTININCKNLKETDKRTVVSRRYNSNAKICQNVLRVVPSATGDAITNPQDISGMSCPFGFSGHSSPQTYRKRKLQELLDASSLCGSFSAEPMDALGNSASSIVSTSSKFPNRPLLAEAIYLPNMVDMCSVFLMASQAAKTCAGKNGASEMKLSRENQTGTVLGGASFHNFNIGPDANKDMFGNNFGHNGNDEAARDKLSKSKGGDEQESRPSSGGSIEIIDAMCKGENSLDQTLNCGNDADYDLKQERAVLETLRDCLKKLITFGYMKGGIKLFLISYNGCGRSISMGKQCSFNKVIKISSFKTWEDRIQ